MWSRTDVSTDARMEIVSRHWRYGDEHGVTTELAREWGVSRRFVYDLSARVREALEPRAVGRPRRDRRDEVAERLRARVAELEADLETARGQLELERRDRHERRTRLLLELALAPVSEAKIARALEAAGGPKARSSAWVHERIERAGQAALRIMKKEEVREAVHEAALDELFTGRRPLLTMVEPRTMMALAPEAASDRRGATWERVLDRYPNLRLAISDQGSGLLKGVELRGGVEHQADLFHFKRSLRRELRRLERYCYGRMARVEVARELVTRVRLLESARVQARVELKAQEAELDRVLTAFDWTELIVRWVEEQAEAFDARRGRIRTYATARRAIDQALELLGEVDEVDVRAIVTIIKGASDRLLTYLRVLERRLRQIDVRWRKVSGSREALFSDVARVWYWRERSARSPTSVPEQKRYLTALAGLEYWRHRTTNLNEVVEDVRATLERVVRASSAVESLNSILRPYGSVKKRLSQGYLALVALYWNTHAIPGRGKKTPFERAGVDLGSDDWVELIEIELRRMAIESAKRN